MIWGFEDFNDLRIFRIWSFWNLEDFENLRFGGVWELKNFEDLKIWEFSDTHINASKNSVKVLLSQKYLEFPWKTPNILVAIATW